MAIKITKCGIGNFAKTIIFPLVNVTIIILFILLLKTTMDVEILEFIIFVIIGVLTYLFIAYLSDRFFNYKIQALIKDKIGRASCRERV